MAYVDCTRPAAARKPFAQIDHEIAADPRLSPTDVRVILALLFYARNKSVCWPSDASIGIRVGRCAGTVQRSLRRLQALGLITRQATPANRTGREILLRWRLTPPAPAREPLASSARDECRKEREKEPPAACPESTPAGSEIDTATLQAWAVGPEPVLARFAQKALASTPPAVEAVPLGPPVLPGQVLGAGSADRVVPATLVTPEAIRVVGQFGAQTEPAVLLPVDFEPRVSMPHQRLPQQPAKHVPRPVPRIPVAPPHHGIHPVGITQQPFL